MFITYIFVGVFGTYIFVWVFGTYIFVGVFGTLLLVDELLDDDDELDVALFVLFFCNT